MIALLFLSGGLFLGWSLGANDAANVFGTAVGSKMVRFKTAALVSGIFIILGAGISGSGAAGTLGQLGTVNRIEGSFIVAIAAASTVYWMTKLNLPVSTTQAIVGAIIGWNLFSQSLTDYNSLTKIVASWIASPLLCALFSIILYQIFKFILRTFKVHLLKLDLYNRAGLVVVGAFGSFALGANNIANVMGVFVSVSPFRPLELGLITLNDATQLFLIGGIAIAVGVFTYSRRVMTTVGTRILKLTPEAALIVVLSSGLVMFIFASERLEFLLAYASLPTVPLVPVSSSQAVIGAVIGIGLVHGGKGLNYKMLGRIASGWITAPLISGVLCFLALFVFQNVFNQQVYSSVMYHVSGELKEKLLADDYAPAVAETLTGMTFPDAIAYESFMAREFPALGIDERKKIIGLSEVYEMKIDIMYLGRELLSDWLSDAQADALVSLDGREYRYLWQLHDDLVRISKSWAYKPDIPRNRMHNRRIKERLDYLRRVFHVQENQGR